MQSSNGAASKVSLNTRFGIGASVLRKEDHRFLTGQGQYTDDTEKSDALQAYFLRSPYAHARFTIADCENAKQAPGVVAVLSAADFKDCKGLACLTLMKQPDGTMPEARDIPLLCENSVHHVGDAIAIVVAETLNQARDASELIEVEFDALPAVADTEGALAENAPVVFESAQSNLAYTHFEGDREQTDSAFANAAQIAEIKIVNNRLVSNYMEPRACVAEWDDKAGTYTLTVSSQGVHRLREQLAPALNVEAEKIRVITPDVGGGFGTKVFCYREYPLCLAVAKKLKQPVRWNSDRSEHFLQDAHGRDNVATARMAMDDSGKFLAIEVDLIAAMGSYFHAFAAFIPFLGVTMTTGLYDIPCMAVTTRGVFTNTTPTDAYRGAGRPEAAYLIERLVDACARKSGLTVDEVRRRNFIKPEQLPYKTPGGRNYDTGEFQQHMELCMERSGWSGFPARRETARHLGKLRGIGMATYIEACAFAGSEPAFLTLRDDGSVLLRIGTQSNGQGHATAYAQIAAAELGMDYNEIEMHQGDTDMLAAGGGTGGSRSVPLGGASVLRAGTQLGQQIREVAAREMDADVANIELAESTARVRESNAFLSYADIAAKASEEERNARGEWQQDEATYPNGTHICEVEIDAESGRTSVIAYTIVDDFGVTVNPVLLQGQVHGGVVQGIGQCLHEHVVYDEDAQLLSATLMDYALPRADDFPGFHFETRNVPSTTNELGIKGAGEAGSIGSCPAVMNAVSDALHREFDNPELANSGASPGNIDIDMPVTPLRMWEKLQSLAINSQLVKV